MACDTPLYTGVQGGSSIVTKRCFGPIFPPVGCHASYLYVDEAYLYTIACPIETTTSTATSTTSTTSTATTTLRPRGELRNSSNSSLNSSLNSSRSVSSGAKNRSKDFNASAPLYYASSTGEKAIRNGALELPPYAIVIATVCISLACILAAVYCLMKRKQRKQRKQRAEKLKRRRSSSVMPSLVRAPERPPKPFRRLSPDEIQEQREKREIQKVLQKLVNTVCRFNGQYPPAPAKKRAKEPPVPPRPRHRRGQPINMRKKTLEYLRRQNPIQTALSKPLEGFTDAGRQRAMRVQAEAAKEGKRQAQWNNKRRGPSRLRKLVRVKELVASKGTSKQ
jgi:hypothetical protein